MENIIFIATIVTISITAVLNAAFYTMIVSEFIRDRKNKKRVKNQEEN